MAHIYSVIGAKAQNDRETWYMIDSSFITTLPDTWGIGEKFLMLPINKWDQEYQRVVLGGITCDSHDYYDSEEHINEVFLPKGANVISTSGTIYNRWGGTVYKWQNSEGWNGRDLDGKEAEQGIYVYDVSSTYVWGQEERKRGWVMLLK